MKLIWYVIIDERCITVGKCIMLFIDMLKLITHTWMIMIKIMNLYISPAGM